MSISALSGASSVQTGFRLSQASQTKSTQSLDSILSKYDSSSTDSDLAKLAQELSSSGFGKSDDVRSALEARGIDAGTFDEIAQSTLGGGLEQAGGSERARRGPPPQQGSDETSSNLATFNNVTSESEDITAYVSDFLEKLRSNTLTEDDQQGFVALFDSLNIPPNGISVNRKI